MFGPLSEKALFRPAEPVPLAAKLAAIFGTSALIVVLQLLHSRIMAVQFWYHLVYFVITLGFIGFAASGTYLAVSRRIHAVPDRFFYALCLTGLAVGILVSRVVLAALPHTYFGFLDVVSLLPLTAAYTALMIPYFFGGLLVGGALRREPRAGGTLYFASLAGSAAGCFAFVALIRPLGAPGLLQLVFAAAAIPALVLWRPTRVAVAVGAAAILAALVDLAILPIHPDRGKQYWWFPGEPVEFSEWNPISRIDVISTARVPTKKHILIDGDAQAPMFRMPLTPPTGVTAPLDTAHRNALYALAGTPAPERALVIGVGGGADVLTAKLHGARTVDAVEINPTSARIMREEYGEYVGHLLARDGVTLFNEDGRTFAARTANRYDAVMLYAVDSLSAASTGAYVLMENYLYTSEAFRRYWQLLSDRGVLQISRWHHPQAPSESLRVFTQALEALAAEGVRDPARHVAVLADSGGPAPFADVLVSRRPLAADQADALRRFAEANGFELAFLPPGLAATPPAGGDNAFRRFAAAFAAGEQHRFYAAYPFNVEPVSDDAPFFFSYRRWRDLLPGEASASVAYYDAIIGTKPLVLLVVLVGLSVALVLGLVVWPLRRSPERRAASSDDVPVLLFFALIGVGFMFIEIPLIQRFVLLLGHPTYSMTVTLPGILLGAALGSYLSGRIRLAAAARIGAAVAGILLSILVLQAGHEALARGVLAWPLAARLTVVALITGAFGVFMGMPFPTAVAALDGKPHLISLGWTVNGGTTVVASVLAIPVAMAWGFSVVLGLAALCYAGAWMLATRWRL